MSELNQQELLQLIGEIAPGMGTAEHESDNEEKFLKNFLPIPNYRYALEPDILLILGGRGVGKTELFRLLAIPSGREALVESLRIRGLPPLSQTTWIAGFGRTRTAEKRFPIPEIVEHQMQEATNIEWRSFWIGLMLGVILEQEEFKLKDFLLEAIEPEIINVLKGKLSLLSDWLPLVNKNIEKLNYVLDKLDEKLLETDDWLFVTYDELDRLVTSYIALANPIRQLLALWLDRWRRWERIRPKIFLRTDLFREEFLSFLDASKLRGHQVELEWKPSWLYQLFVKRLANSGPEMTEYLQKIPELIIENRTSLGWTATSNEKLFEELIEKMIGKYMGANPKKGITYRWIPNHLQDAGGRIAPRSFLKLFALSAKDRRESNSIVEDTKELLQPSDLQAALTRTSEDRIRELQDEYPWLESLKTSLVGLEAPIPREKFLDAVKSTKWSEQREKQPPTTNPEEILQYLLLLGVVETRYDGRINIPEIYLYGFQVKRRGGVKRAK
ncbi:MAG: hypothetical protein JGK17_16655 [Microcoleus sp. PH2017_10_PVI_O_A]|uniref:P-loop ATPase, Sll1717 family n=1 Tax=unclassified Microcoleus TaxID=2642155 RepID=UPI001D2896CD|nr:MULTISPECIES: hypothetical protein [unclassified Microcoleus]TAE81415.1 MAG: hypothetical protein EAZ83_15120 [Oscillatoriales cyanobacterium]MCC3407191.1 hypothetical protein [Microcoleus sp. PH2017_10_PVI_O_A]MCC3461211.1 hypothetical protein [Microcoleus sp. PH2017_11_PCY_U_A]MCC3479722.1 hypothetical protein [Microcoleus sp. PH2017_12_PCY_D_A]MCC3529694.1 hypothetical protein [Microcoleus sp. PH2017_21_RUC_O_A]